MSDEQTDVTGIKKDEFEGPPGSGNWSKACPRTLTYVGGRWTEEDTATVEAMGGRDVFMAFWKAAQLVRPLRNGLDLRKSAEDVALMDAGMALIVPIGSKWVDPMREAADACGKSE